MKNRVWYIAVLIMCSKTVAAQNEEAFIQKSFVIIQSTKKYAVAKHTAENAAKQLHQQLNLRELKPNKETGLTFADSICEADGGYPCYIARGRYDDGDYVSIEWSSAFNTFAKGYYIVVMYSGDNAGAKRVLQKAKPLYKDAYYKNTKVYVGCMH